MAERTAVARLRREVYAKLLGLIVQHWVTLTGTWSRPDRSLVKAAQTVRTNVPLLAVAFAGLMELAAALRVISNILGMGCRMNPRRKHPNTYQLLLALERIP